MTTVGFKPIIQSVFKTGPSSIEVIVLDEPNFSSILWGDLLATLPSNTYGISGIYDSKSVLTTVAFASTSRAIVVHLPCKPKSNTAARKSLVSVILRSGTYEKIGFDMDRLATSLHLDHDLRITSAIDGQSLAQDGSFRGSNSTLMDALGGSTFVDGYQASQIFLHHPGGPCDIDKCALRAWCAWKLTTLKNYGRRRKQVCPINTETIDRHILDLLAKFVRDNDRRSALDPTVVKNHISPDILFDPTKRLASFQSTRFKTRMRESQDQFVMIENQGSTVSRAVGRVVKAVGKSATVMFNTPFKLTNNFSVSTFGKGYPGLREKTRDPFPQHLFFENPIVRCQLTRAPKASVGLLGGRLLNMSQRKAIGAIVSSQPADNICIIQGPPGTGKTTVIAGSVLEIMNNMTRGGPQGIWLVAQSNLAVKNIAERLVDIGFWNFKLIVSKAFYFDWHEHLYRKIEGNVIRADTLSNKQMDDELRIAGSNVILCTLDMLSSEKLRSGAVTKVVPVEVVIVDEASQIEIGDYLPLLYLFRNKLRKLAFIGDDKQLAPYGQEEIQGFQSVFEVKHLRERSIFLDTQYRMPRPIGEFISAEVYNGRLRTQHQINDRKSCRFVDVHNGKEVSCETSWINAEEVIATIHVARAHHKKGNDFKIITPYDAQRDALEQALKDSEIPWEDKCFNVDSFQGVLLHVCYTTQCVVVICETDSFVEGNEADHIIISVVRSAKLGFLNNERRTNVMLSRCKKSMTICSSRRYLGDIASTTLIGRLAKAWGESGWISYREAISGKF